MLITHKDILNLKRKESIGEVANQFFHIISIGICGKDPNYFKKPVEVAFIYGVDDSTHYYETLKVSSSFKKEFMKRLDKWISRTLDDIACHAEFSTETQDLNLKKVDLKLVVNCNDYQNILVTISSNMPNDEFGKSLQIIKPLPQKHYK